MRDLQMADLALKALPPQGGKGWVGGGDLSVRVKRAIGLGAVQRQARQCLARTPNPDPSPPRGGRELWGSVSPNWLFPPIEGEGSAPRSSPPHPMNRRSLLLAAPAAALGACAPLVQRAGRLVLGFAGPRLGA